MKRRETYLDTKLEQRADDNRVRVLHDKYQRWTISYIVLNSNQPTASILAAIAIRNLKDNFNRKLGRVISKGRLLAYLEAPPQDSFSLHERVKVSLLRPPASLNTVDDRALNSFVAGSDLVPFTNLAGRLYHRGLLE